MTRGQVFNFITMDEKDFDLSLSADNKKALKALQVGCRRIRKDIFDGFVRNPDLPANCKVTLQNLITSCLQAEFMCFNLLIDSEDYE